MGDKFWNRVEVRGPNECWNWVGPRHGKGYGVFRGQGMRSVFSHRYAMSLHLGRDPQAFVLHSCGNRACVNPAHLREETQDDRFWSKVEVKGPNECWEWQARTNAKGYGTFKIANKSVLAHRHSLSIHLRRELTACALHSCDNPPCVNPAHLREGTQTDNVRDSIERNRWADQKGDCNSRAKLTETDVIDMRRRKESGERVVDIAKHYPFVSENTVGWAIRGITWSHVREGLEP